jgi:hypothetical protein
VLTRDCAQLIAITAGRKAIPGMGFGPAVVKLPERGSRRYISMCLERARPRESGLSADLRRARHGKLTDDGGTVQFAAKRKKAAVASGYDRVDGDASQLNALLDELEAVLPAFAAVAAGSHPAQWRRINTGLAAVRMTLSGRAGALEFAAQRRPIESVSAGRGAGDTESARTEDLFTG